VQAYKILYGNKTVLYPFFPDKDMAYFWEVYGEGSPEKLGEWMKVGDADSISKFIVRSLDASVLQMWIGYTKEGKASKRCGIIYIIGVKPHIVSIHGAADKRYIKGLDKKLKEKNKVTFTEDAFKAVLNYCFDTLKVDRVETTIEKSNKLAQALAVKCGMEKEGVLRKYIKVDDHAIDMVMLSKIKE
jgi:RimJ/RimL family protein N-acetyltransferase